MQDYKDNFNNAIDFAVKKTQLKWWKLVFLGIMGCIYVGIAYIAFIMIIAGMQDSSVFPEGWQEDLISNTSVPAINMTGWPLVVAAAIFPVGLLLIIFLGGSLFTSDNLTSIAILTKQVKVSPVILKWGLTLLGNIIGAFIIAALARGSYIFNDKQLFVLQQIITKKVNMEWWQAFFSGILCNILVAGTVWSTLAAKHSIAKIFLIYFPILLFAIVGFQHVTANSILFAFGWTHADSPIIANIGQGILTTPIGLLDWSFRSIFINMLPAMIGNWLSGAIFLPFVYFWLSDNHKIIKKQKEALKNNKNNKNNNILMPEEEQEKRNNNNLKYNLKYDENDELSEEEIPHFEEFYENKKDLRPADVLVKTNENNFEKLEKD